jgi:hypothetical protein
MLEAELNMVHTALIDFAVRHDVFLSVLLVAPVVITYFFSYVIVRDCKWPTDVLIRRRTCVLTGLSALFLTAGALYALPSVLRILSFGRMCMAVAFMMLILGACCGVFAASLTAWRRAGAE